MKDFKKKDLLLVSLMLFSLFFGAGNLIFPPFLGQSAGTSTWIAMDGFFITAVGFPIMGVVAVAKSKGLENLGRRVNPVFAVVFSILIYLSIGPGLGIPRAGSLPFEMAIAPYLPSRFSVNLARALYTLVFFSVAFWLALTPKKLVDRMGKFLTPLLLTLIALLFIASIVKPLGGYGAVSADYKTSPFIKGFLDGYLTMDTIAALNFGIVIAMAIGTKGVKEESAVIKITIQAGLIAGALLVAIYSILAHLGAGSGGAFGATENGAQTLTNVVTYIFGDAGAVLLAVIFTLACLTTSVGLITSCSEYFSSFTKKMPYKVWAAVLTLFSMLVANLGLNQILAISVPILNAIYPVAIMLIVLSVADRFIEGSRAVYSATILFTAVVSIVDALGQAGVNLRFVAQMFSKLPLYSKGLGWVVPALAAMAISTVFSRIMQPSSQNEMN